MIQQKNIHTLIKAVIIVLIVLPLSLPCTVKREIKRIFNIPVAAHPFKSNRTITVCSTFSAEHTRNSSVTIQKKKEVFTNPFFYSIGFQKILFFALYPPIVLEKEPAGSVPLYILHRQYRS